MFTTINSSGDSVVFTTVISAVGIDVRGHSCRSRLDRFHRNFSELMIHVKRSIAMQIRQTGISVKSVTSIGSVQASC